MEIDTLEVIITLISAQSTSDITNYSNLMAATEPLAATITLYLSTNFSVLGFMIGY